MSAHKAMKIFLVVIALSTASLFGDTPQERHGNWPKLYAMLTRAGEGEVIKLPETEPSLSPRQMAHARQLIKRARRKIDEV